MKIYDHSDLKINVMNDSIQIYSKNTNESEYLAKNDLNIFFQILITSVL